MPGNPPLTVQERSCLLRAARIRLDQLHAEYQSAYDHGNIETRADLINGEIICLTASIKWLWLIQLAS